ncbi:MAG TPA: hypothetical protein VKP10_12165 [Gemmatimonadales bacterium]|nr:hypothetical protein [Gemmatimonadales bacterium]
MKTNRWIGLGLSLGLLSTGLACGDNAIAPKPKAGSVTVSLTTPNADDGAVLVALFGPGFANVRPSSASYRLYSLTASPTEIRILVVGDLSTGALLSLDIDDPARIAEYHGTVIQAASRDDIVHTVSTDYDLTFAAR